jgi:flagellar FliJ protein
MKRFKFSLESLLVLRQREEQAALEEYSRALLERDRAMSRVAAAETELAQTWSALRNEMADGCPAAKIAYARSYCREVEETKTQCERALQQAELKLNQANRKMVLALQSREAVEKFRDRQREGYDREMRREEQKLIDDLVSSRLAQSLAMQAGFQPSVN